MPYHYHLARSTFCKVELQEQHATFTSTLSSSRSSSSRLGVIYLEVVKELCEAAWTHSKHITYIQVNICRNGKSKFRAVNVLKQSKYYIWAAVVLPYSCHPSFSLLLGVVLMQPHAETVQESKG